MLDLVESKFGQHEAFRADVLAGLSQRQKTLPSRWLYDQRGSELFEEITGLDEYYYPDSLRRRKVLANCWALDSGWRHDSGGLFVTGGTLGADCAGA